MLLPKGSSGCSSSQNTPLPATPRDPELNSVERITDLLRNKADAEYDELQDGAEKSFRKPEAPVKEQQTEISNQQMSQVPDPAAGAAPQVKYIF